MINFITFIPVHNTISYIKTITLNVKVIHHVNHDSLGRFSGICTALPQQIRNYLVHTDEMKPNFRQYDSHFGPVNVMQSTLIEYKVGQWYAKNRTA